MPEVTYVSFLNNRKKHCNKCHNINRHLQNFEQLVASYLKKSLKN